MKTKIDLIFVILILFTRMTLYYSIHNDQTSANEFQSLLQTNSKQNPNCLQPGATPIMVPQQVYMPMQMVPVGSVGGGGVGTSVLPSELQHDRKFQNIMRDYLKHKHGGKGHDDAECKRKDESGTGETVKHYTKKNHIKEHIPEPDFSKAKIASKPKHKAKHYRHQPEKHTNTTKKNGKHDHKDGKNNTGKPVKKEDDEKKKKEEEKKKKEEEEKKKKEAEDKKKKEEEKKKKEEAEKKKKEEEEKKKKEEAEKKKKEEKKDDSKKEEKKGGSSDDDKKREAELKEQRKAQEAQSRAINGLVTEIRSISKKIEESADKTDKMFESIQSIKESFEGLQEQITMQGIKFDWKLNMINKKILKQLEITLMREEIKLQKEIMKTKHKLRKLRLKIKSLKSKLPSTTSVCNKLLSCGSCTANPECGWCSMTQTCVEGNEKGPTDGSCTFYDYKVCSGPKSCDSYKDCNTCIKDVACGWCNDFTKFPTCMSKKDGDKGNCRIGSFIHQWKSLNSCPHVKMANFKDYVLHELKKPLKDELAPPRNNTIVLKLDPIEMKKLKEMLNIYQKEKVKEEVNLDKQVKLLNKTHEELENIDEDESKFNMLNVTDDQRQKIFYQQTRAIFSIMKDYLINYNLNMIRKLKNERLNKTKHSKYTNKTIKLCVKSKKDKDTEICRKFKRTCYPIKHKGKKKGNKTKNISTKKKSPKKEPPKKKLNPSMNVQTIKTKDFICKIKKIKGSLTTCKKDKKGKKKCKPMNNKATNKTKNKNKKDKKRKGKSGKNKSKKKSNKTRNQSIKKLIYSNQTAKQLLHRLLKIHKGKIQITNNSIKTNKTGKKNQVDLPELKNIINKYFKGNNISNAQISKTTNNTKLLKFLNKTITKLRRQNELAKKNRSKKAKNTSKKKGVKKNTTKKKGVKKNTTKKKGVKKNTTKKKGVKKNTTKKKGVKKNTTKKKGEKKKAKKNKSVKKKNATKKNKKDAKKNTTSKKKAAKKDAPKKKDNKAKTSSKQKQKENSSTKAKDAKKSAKKAFFEVSTRLGVDFNKVKSHESPIFSLNLLQENLAWKRRNLRS